jgi:glycosyltransferase involved in cell wall biosynthesis
MRETLHRTALSLKNQTRDKWEAIIGIDVKNVNYTNVSSQFNDNRFSYMLISTAKTDRGPSLNGAGELRNTMITAARGEWVAFVDDDDTISPYYVEWLEDCLLGEKKRDEKRVDLVLFRMRIARKFQPDETILPPFSHKNTARNSWVGISFAVRRNLFTSNKLAFTTHNAEDYKLLKAAYDIGINMKIANLVGYFVKTNPEMLPGSCSLSNLTIR